MSKPIWQLEACEIADQVRSGQVAAKEVLESFLERIESFNDELKAFVHLDVAGARAQAAEIDRRIAARENPGPLAGVPIGVKDLEDAAGMPTTHGSLIFRGNIADSDSIQVARLRAAGCVVVGKTAAPEFGAAAYTSTPLHGTTRNPWDLSRTPGGSSGGSAAAVAAGLIPIATGSDGGGSIRIPASYSGLFGPKGTFGRVPRGRAPESSYTSVYGPMARSVRDAARYLDCVTGPDERDQFSLPHPVAAFEQSLEDLPTGLTATWSADLGFGTCAGDVAEIARDAAEVLSKEGVLSFEDVPVRLKDPSRAWGILGAAEAWIRQEPFWETRREELSPFVRFSMEQALEHLDLKELAKAHQRRWVNNQTLAEIFERVDLIVTPTTATTAFAAEGPMPTEIDGKTVKPMHAISFTYPFNMSGHPAVSIPCGFDKNRLPVGLQMVGRRNTDHLLLAIAFEFERIAPWPKIATNYLSK